MGDVGLVVKELAKPLGFDKREPCKSCPYRIDAPINLWSDEEFEHLLAHGEEDMPLYGCHEYRKRKDEAQVCVGWLIAQRETGVRSIPLRLALMQLPEALACFKEAESPVELYGSIEEMCEANGVER